MKKFAIDSFVVLLCFSVGGTLGYIYAASECAHLKQATEEQAFFMDGRWIYRAEMIEAMKERNRAKRLDNQ